MSLEKLNRTINEKIKSFATVQTVWVQVDKVNWDEKTMTATSLADELPYYDILLGLENLMIRPKQGTTCLIGLIENDSTKPFLIWADEVEQYSITVENTEFKIQEVFLLRKDNETLAKLMRDLLVEIQNMKFLTAAGGPTTKLINKPKFKTIENRFKQFLKEN